mmetsp:Transcript_61706/g.99813  ORF Transcript_61706/g.99813 Transcript_61706/m.99813 type:complete len:201 (+) Transcript_61706:1401-2003(+)
MISRMRRTARRSTLRLPLSLYHWQVHHRIRRCQWRSAARLCAKGRAQRSLQMLQQKPRPHRHRRRLQRQTCAQCRRMAAASRCSTCTAVNGEILRTPCPRANRNRNLKCAWLKIASNPWSRVMTLRAAGFSIPTASASRTTRLKPGVEVQAQARHSAQTVARAGRSLPSVTLTARRRAGYRALSHTEAAAQIRDPSSACV